MRHAGPAQRHAPDLGYGVLIGALRRKFLPLEQEQQITAIDELMHGRTTLVIAHRLSTLRSVDEIIVFEHGAVVEHGARSDLIGDDESRFAGLLALALEREQPDGATGSEVTP